MKTENNDLRRELADRTQEIWQPRIGRDLSRDEAKQIAAGVTGFFLILAEWSRADMAGRVNDSGGANTSKGGGAAK
jgi:hypothetical protein